MDFTSPPWCCQRCGTAFISDPPEYRLCGQCLADLQSLTRTMNPDAPPCPACGGPVCPDCGQAMTVLVPVPVPAAAPATAPDTLAVQLVTGYRPHPDEKVTGDDH